MGCTHSAASVDNIRSLRHGSHASAACLCRGAGNEYRVGRSPRTILTGTFVDALAVMADSPMKSARSVSIDDVSPGARSLFRSDSSGSASPVVQHTAPGPALVLSPRSRVQVQAPQLNAVEVPASPGLHRRREGIGGSWWVQADDAPLSERLDRSAVPNFIADTGVGVLSPQRPSCRPSGAMVSPGSQEELLASSVEIWCGGADGAGSPDLSMRGGKSPRHSAVSHCVPAGLATLEGLRFRPIAASPPAHQHEND